ncbi:MAG: MnmC family methyltransferase, partial [Acidobacteriota bacterium]
QLGDVGALVAGSHDAFDAILLDVDNGPDAFTHPDNARLYSAAGLAEIRRALRRGGRLALWSSGPDAAFTRRLKDAGYRVEEKKVRARRNKGARRVIWLADR